MTRGIKKYFSFEENISKFIFTLVIVVVFSLVFGQAVYANFIGTGGSSGTFGYQYGYGDSGYGYGYGYGVGGNAAYGSGPDGKATSVSATAAKTSFTVTYSTNYLAENRINYGKTDSYGSNSSQTSFQTGSNSIQVTGLTCNTTYHYQVESTDAGSNVWYSADATVKTTACSSGNGGGSSGGNNGSIDISACTATTLFSPVTGARCPSPNVNPAGCQPGFLFSTITGQRCPLIEQTATFYFTRNLTIGSRGDDIRQLQIYLNTHGFPVALTGPGSLGHETNYFGPLTRAALARFQAAHGITPSVGYFGPITRAYINTHQF